MDTSFECRTKPIGTEQTAPRQNLSICTSMIASFGVITKRIDTSHGESSRDHISDDRHADRLMLCLHIKAGSWADLEDNLAKTETYTEV